MFPTLILLAAIVGWLWAEAKAPHAIRVVMGVICMLAVAGKMAITIHNDHVHLAFHRMAMRHLSRLLEGGQLDKEHQLDVRAALQSYEKESDDMGVASLLLVNEMLAIPTKQ